MASGSARGRVRTTTTDQNKLVLCSLSPEFEFVNEAALARQRSTLWYPLSPTLSIGYLRLYFSIDIDLDEFQILIISLCSLYWIFQLLCKSHADTKLAPILHDIKSDYEISLMYGKP